MADNRYYFNRDDLRRNRPNGDNNGEDEPPPSNADEPPPLEPDDDAPEETGPQSPASVVFMQMMRQHASDQDESEAEAPPAEEPVELAAPQKFASEEERQQAAAMEAQRLRRLQRRQEKRRRQTVSTMAGLVRSVIVVVVSAALIATILAWFIQPESLDFELRAQLAQVNATPVPAMVTTPIPTPNFLRRIGIVSGHYGKTPDDYLAPVDPGAICPDGLTENEINFDVATRVVVQLRDAGYTVDLLEEWDNRLGDYQADLLLSLHSNDCSDYGEFVSGFLVSQAQSRPTGGPDERLVNCIAFKYGELTGLEQRFGLTRDMTDYHIFRSISPTTPGAILEMGFMKDDREILTTQPDLLAQAIVEGITCYLDPTATIPVPVPDIIQQEAAPTADPNVPTPTWAPAGA